MIYQVFCSIGKIFTLCCRSYRRAFDASLLAFAVTTAFLYISRRVSSNDTILVFDVDCTCFVSVCLYSCSSSFSPVISCNSAYMIYKKYVMFRNELNG